MKAIEVPSRVDGMRRNLARLSDLCLGMRLAEPQETKSLMSDGTCFSHDKKEKFTCFTVKLAS